MSQAAGDEDFESAASRQTRFVRALDIVCVVLFAGLALSVLALSVYQPLVPADFGMRLAARRFPDLSDLVNYLFTSWSFTWPVFGLQLLFAEHRLVAGVANAVGFLGLGLLVPRVAWGRWPARTRRDVVVVAFLTCAFWFSLPSMVKMGFSATGTASFLWPTILMLAFAAPYGSWLQSHRGAVRARSWTVAFSLGLFLLGFSAGSSSRSVVYALAALLVLCAVIAARRWPEVKPPAPLYAGAAGLALGAWLMSSAPGALLSAGSGTAVVEFGDWIQIVAASVWAPIAELIPRTLPWLLAALLAAARVSGRESGTADRHRITSMSWALSVTALASIVPFVTSPNLVNGTAMTVPVILVWVAVMALFADARDPSALETAPKPAAMSILAIALVIATASAAQAAVVTASISAQMARREVQIARQRAGSVADIVVAPIAAPQRYGVYFREIAADPGAPDNRLLSQWYGVKSLRVGDPFAAIKRRRPAFESPPASSLPLSFVPGDRYAGIRGIAPSGRGASLTRTLAGRMRWAPMLPALRESHPALLGPYYFVGNPFDPPTSLASPRVSSAEETWLVELWQPPAYEAPVGTFDHPVLVAQEGLAALTRYGYTGDRRFRERAMKAADWLVEKQHVDGSWRYQFPFEGLKPGWVSGMAQGQAVSLLARAYQWSGDARYLDAARAGYAFMMVRVEDGGTLGSFSDGGPVLEEYPGGYHPQVLNGNIFAMWGVRDLALVTDDADVMASFDALADALVRHLPDYSTGTWSTYSLRPDPSRRAPASPGYHRIHIQQLRVMQQMTGDPRWGDVARVWYRDLGDWTASAEP